MTTADPPRVFALYRVRGSAANYTKLNYYTYTKLNFYRVFALYRVLQSVQSKDSEGSAAHYTKLN